MIFVAVLYSFISQISISNLLKFFLLKRDSIVSISKTKLVTKFIAKNNKGNKTHSFYGKRTQSKAKSQYIAPSSMSTHDFVDQNDNSSRGNDSLVIECSYQYQHGYF